MIKKIVGLSFAASATLFAQSDLEQLKTQLAQQQRIIAALQQRLEELETKQSSASAAATANVQAPSSTFDQKSFLPDIALILNGSAVGRNVNNSTYESYFIPGFGEFDPQEESEIPYNKNRGFNFNYAEIAMHSTVGPYFDADAVFHLHPDEFEIEEAYITSRAFPYGLRAKAGKFLSDFGRINPIHQHAWDFTSQPLAYEAIFGAEGLNDAGVQLQWILPTDAYLMAGVEALQGSNDVSFGDIEKNNLYVGYLKTGTDLTDNTTLLGGLSIAHGKNEEGLDTDVYGADLTFKMMLDSYSSLAWQSELLYRDKDTSQGDQDQAGYYTQLVYDYNQNWATGIRYERLYKNLADMPHDLDRTSAMLEYKPFEFSKFRLQYAYDRSKMFGDERKNISEILLDFTIEAGAHGAHAF
ncbi:MAG: hypothetical protein IE885_01635 [Campylobacterales bacterium]|nr:hypothetical protein [Campylobacterales bacterium]